MKTIKEYLSGQFDEELRVIVAKARGWTNDFPKHTAYWTPPIGTKGGRFAARRLPPYPISRDACEELLADLTEEELCEVGSLLGSWDNPEGWLSGTLLRATARQICIAFLVTKGILK